MADESTTSSREEDSMSERNSDVESLEKGEAFNYDDILENHLGQMGKYQLLTFLWLCVPALFPGFITMSYTFTGGIPDYRCYIEGCDDFIDSTEVNPFSPSWLNNTIPWDGSTNSHDQCKRYNSTWTNLDECREPNNLEIVKQCDEWVYDKSLFKSTIVTEFELTCDDEWKRTLASSIYMFGMLVGGATLGHVADAIGRRLAYTLNVFVMATMTTSLAFSPNFVVFCIIRFICGITCSGHFLIYFVWGVEAVGKKYRALVGFSYEIMFSLGSVILGVIAYYVREWKTLQLIISAPMFALLTIYWIVPESIRWLIIKKRYPEARNLILKAAKTNKKNVPAHLILIPSENISTAIDKSQVEGNSSSEGKKDGQNESIINVFRSPILLKRLVVMFLAWFATLFAYFGITFSATNLSEKYHLNYGLSMLVELPAYIAGIFVLNKIGRRSTLSGGLIFCGLASLITGLVPDDAETVRVVFSLIGKLFVSCVFGTVYSYTSDLFPTPARSTTVGLCNIFGQVGGILAPILANAGRKIDPALPFLVIAGVSISIGLLSLILPETNNKPLPGTIEEAEDLEKYTLSFLRCSSKKVTENLTDPNNDPSI